MTRLVFAVLFALNFLVLPGEGQISPPPEGDTIYGLPGQNVTMAWKVDAGLSLVSVSWTLLSQNGSFAEIGLSISKTPEYSPGPFTIQRPSTLILENVNMQYNGTYRFKILLAGGQSHSSDVTLIILGPLVTHPTTISKIQERTTRKGNETAARTTNAPITNNSGRAKTALKECNCSGTEWYIVVGSIMSGIIIGLFLAYILLCSRRRWIAKSRKPKRHVQLTTVQPGTTEVDPTYQELDLTKMNTEDNYQSLRVGAASNNAANDDDSNYTELSKARDAESNYQSLT